MKRAVRRLVVAASAPDPDEMPRGPSLDALERAVLALQRDSRRESVRASLPFDRKTNGPKAHSAEGHPL
jgi:hypothetical protein